MHGVTLTLPAYGSYNQYVLDASYSRGQAVVLWDLECVDRDYGCIKEEIIDPLVALETPLGRPLICQSRATKRGFANAQAQFWR